MFAWWLQSSRRRSEGATWRQEALARGNVRACSICGGGRSQSLRENCRATVQVDTCGRRATGRPPAVHRRPRFPATNGSNQAGATNAAGSTSQAANPTTVPVADGTHEFTATLTVTGAVAKTVNFTQACLPAAVRDSGQDGLYWRHVEYPPGQFGG